MDIDTLVIETLIRDEGYRPNPYECTAGKTTIGYGRNLDDKGINKAEALYLLKNDIAEAKRELSYAYPFIQPLSVVRQAVLINMCVNLGLTKLRGFKRMWLAVEAGLFTRAADEMIDSDWHKQVGNRAIRLEKMMREG